MSDCMKKDGKPSGFIIFVIVFGTLLLLTQTTGLNNIPGVEVSGSEIIIDLGDFHYHS